MMKILGLIFTLLGLAWSLALSLIMMAITHDGTVALIVGLLSIAVIAWLHSEVKKHDKMEQ
jgi:hypothetical protein